MNILHLMSKRYGIAVKLDLNSSIEKLKTFIEINLKETNGNLFNRKKWNIFPFFKFFLQICLPWEIMQSITFLLLTTFMVKEYPDSDYIYVNINWQFRIVFKDSCSKCFNDIDNLKLCPPVFIKFLFFTKS